MPAPEAVDDGPTELLRKVHESEMMKCTEKVTMVVRTG
jgi:hypothetical protein